MNAIALLAQSGGGSSTVMLGVLLGAIAGGGIVWGALYFRSRAGKTAHAAQLERELDESRRKREELLSNAEIEAQKKLLEMMNRFERETAETREELKSAEKRITKREDSLDKKLDVLSTKERKIEESQQQIAESERRVTEQREEVEETLDRQRDELLRISKMTADQAKAQCLSRLEHEVEREAGQMVERILGTAEENARERARKITIEAIQRYAAENTCEATVASVDVPSDDMKGRIIGREGRNIRAFEKVTGVSVIVDDTPGIVSISCFDPVRKEVARLALEHLIKDGRIHPTRIEELVPEIEQQVQQRIVEAGRQAAIETNVNGLNKKVLELLGRLQFRTSYGQNVLRHSIEVAFATGIMADELGLDAALGRRCGLVHDIGKALSHELDGTHTKVGADFMRRFNENEAVLNAVEGHHGDVAAATPYTPLVTAADAMSASRPGSRRESIERYIKRLQELEGIATGFEGVRQAYAVEAGREVRVIVDAVRVDDRSSLKLARDIAKRIEETMTFPGEIKVTVLREIRAVEYAR